MRMTPERRDRMEMMMRSYTKYLDEKLSLYDGEIEWCTRRFERLVWELSVLPITDCCVQAYHEAWDNDGNDHNPCIVIDLILTFRHGYKLWVTVTSAPYIEEDPDIPENIMFSIWKHPKRDKDGHVQQLVSDMTTIDDFMDAWFDMIPKLNKIDDELEKELNKQDMERNVQAET